MLRDNSSLVDLSSIKNVVRQGVKTIELMRMIVGGSLSTIRAVSMQDLNFENPSDIFDGFNSFNGLVMLNLRGLACYG